MSPATPQDAKELLKAAVRDDNPVVFIEGEVLYGRKGPVPEEEYTIPLGRGEVKKEGEDVTLVAWSKMLYGVLTAADERRLTGWTRSGAGNGRGCAHALCQEP